MHDEPIPPCSVRRKRRWFLWIAIAVILAGSAAWIFRPYPHPEESLVDPRLRALKKPYRSLSCANWLDGGSASVTITDAGGEKLEFFIPFDEEYSSVYLRLDPQMPDRAVPASNHTATRQELIAILAEYGQEWDDWAALAKMSGRLRDKLRLELLRLRRKLEAK